MNDEFAVAPVELPELHRESVQREGSFLNRHLDLIRGVEVRVTVVLGESRMTLSELENMSVGDLVVLNRLVGEPLDLLVNDQAVARGELVVVGDALGFRVLETSA